MKFLHDLSMTPKLLQSFLKLAEIGNVSRAATQLHLTQPALSRQIRQLEQEIAAPLFERHGRGVVLTEAGEVLRQRAVRLLREIDDIRRELARSELEPEGEISIGLPSPLKSILSCPLVESLLDTAPRLQLRIFEGSPVQVRELLNAGTLDLGVLSGDEHGAGLSRVPFVSERLFVAGAPGSGIDPESQFDVEKLLDIPLVQASPQNGVTMLLNRHFSKSQRGLDLRVEASSTHLLIGIAATGRCYTVLPYSALMDDLQSGKIIAAPLSRLSMHWALARRADHRVTVGMRAVLDTIHRIARTEIESGAWRTAQYDADGANP